jgi:hemoglobin
MQVHIHVTHASAMNKPSENPAVAVAIAPSVASTTEARNPHFVRIGGLEPIERLVDRFYFHMDTLPEASGIRAMHPPNLAPVKRVLTHFLTEWMGGPQAYSIERGHPRLRRKHMTFSIGPAERDAWMQCMRLALAEVVPDTALQTQLAEAFFKTADFIRNDQGHNHDHHR